MLTPGLAFSGSLLASLLLGAFCQRWIVLRDGVVGVGGGGGGGCCRVYSWF